MATNNLCSVCVEIFDGVFPFLSQWHSYTGIPFEGDAYLHLIRKRFWSLTEWESSALSCHLCAVFYQGRNAKRIENLATIQPDAEIFADYESASGMSGIDLTLRTSVVGLGTLVNLPMNFKLHLPETGEPISPQPAALPTTWSPAIVEQLKSWLLKCTNSHPECISQSSKRHRLPLRLIDVDPSSRISTLEQDSHDLAQLSLERAPLVRLCSTSELPETTEYLTLSHRWDPNPSILLSNTTLPLFVEGIPPSLLGQPGSKTFKDAIVVTRSLGFRYLWIDSVCINQEDEAEKSIEITFMDKIYSRSSGNISATGATRGADGLFFEREPLAIDPCRKKFTTPSASKPLVEVVASMSGRWEKHVTGATINTRGWVFQERMLAPKVIHFARDQVYWECFTTETSESSTKGARDQSGAGFVLRKGAMMQISNNRGFMDWNIMVPIYTNLFLTFPRDRLLAISAIARYFCEKRELQAHEYLAGLWRPNLPYCLNWACTEHRPKSGDYIAPSWSWASIGAPINFYTHSESSPLVDIINTSVTPKQGDSFGEISSGHIRVHCSLCQAFWQGDGKELNIVTSNGNTLPALDVYKGGGFSIKWDYEVFKTGTFQASDFWLPLPSDRLYFLDDSFYLMPVEVVDCEKQISGLILHRTLQRGQYVRVGLFQYAEPEEDSDDDHMLSDWSDGEIRISWSSTPVPLSPDRSDRATRQIEMTTEISKALSGKLQVLDAENSLREIVDGKYLIEIV